MFSLLSRITRNRAAGAILLSLAALLPNGGAAAESAPQNVASAREGAVAIADSEFTRFTSASLGIDGISLGPGASPEANRWHAARGKAHPHWIWIRFLQRARIAKVVVHRAELLDYPVDFVGEYSADGGVTFVTLFAVTNNHMSEAQYAIERTFKPVVTDNFRLRILRSSDLAHPDYAQLSEVEVFGEFLGPRTPRPAKDSPYSPIPAVLAPTSTDGLEVVQRRAEIEFRSKWLRVAFSKNAPRITTLCWDSLGEGKVKENLLKQTPDGGMQLSQAPLFRDFDGPGVRQKPTQASVEMDGNVVRYSQRLPGGAQARWEIRVQPKSIQMTLASITHEATVAREPLGVSFVFDANRTPVTALANPKSMLPASLPCLLHAPDYGSLLVQPVAGGDVCLIAEPAIHSLAQWTGFLRKAERGRPSDGLFMQSAGATRVALELSVESCVPLPELAARDERLRYLARSWLNTFQYKADVGILANNTVSDNASFCMFTFTDPAVFTPTLAGGIEPITLARESLERYFAGASGTGVGYEDIETDTYPSLLISAWDVIRVTGDLALLRRWLPTLERIAASAEAQDRDGNGLPESTRSGLAGTAVRPTGNWWDLINFGHEDAYVCALSYRAYRGLADLERLANRSEPAARFDQRAERIKAAYVPTFLNPRTGIIAGWKDSRGNLHDYWFISINGMAITYGLVPEQLANSIVDKIEGKRKEAGFARFDLGLPNNLIPIAKADYIAGALGSPKKADGTDTFGVFENGGASACYAYFYVQALYQLGRRTEAERILWPMMKTFAQGGFQNGVGHGGEWRHWDGRPSGYEGFLADAYYAQLAVFTGHFGIGFYPEGFRLEKWSPLTGGRVPLGLTYMGKPVEFIE